MRKLGLEELGRKSLDEFRESDKFPITVILDNIRSAMNVGSFFRTADAFAIKKLVLCGISAQPPHREITKTAIGATHSVDWEYHQDILSYLDSIKGENVQIIGVEQTDSSLPLSDFEPNRPEIVLVFGNEVQGLGEGVLPKLDLAVEIPQYGTKHSLNVSVCAGIVIHEVLRKMEFV